MSHCDYSSGDAPSFSEARMVKARKPHKCCECREPIKTGEMYERTSGLWDAGYQAFKTCAHCADLRKAAYGECEHDEGPAFGQLACWYADRLAHLDAVWMRENFVGPPKRPLWWGHV